MESLWPSKIRILDIISPKEMLELQAKFLSKLTNDMVYAEVVDVTKTGVHPVFSRNDFVYRFDIKGKFIDGYKYSALTIGHNISLYPALISLDKDIASDCSFEKSNFEINSQEDLKDNLKSILNSNKIMTVISSMLKLSN